MALNDQVRDTIDNMLSEHSVFLFMKGTPDSPQCGFSATTSGILNSLSVPYATFDVLEDQVIREGIKEYGDWPTIPQLYINKELVGGNDIINEMFNSGELHQMLGLEAPDRTPPVITIDDQAAEAISQGMAGQPGADLHFKIDEFWQPQFMMQQANGNEIKAEAGGIVFHMDVMTAQRARGAAIGWQESFQGSGLTVDLPEAPPPVGVLSVQDLKTKLDAGEPMAVVDIRNEAERVRAAVDFAFPLDQAGIDRIGQMGKDEPLAFLCHHGRSSLSAAEHFRKEGYTNLWNILGGINAWSKEIDPSVPTY